MLNDNNTYIKIGLAGLMMALASCGGTGSTTSAAATSGTRTISGEVPVATSAGLTRALTTGACSADTVITTDTLGTTQSADVSSEDCSFTITLTTGKSYVIGFVLEDEFVATLTFDSGVAGFASSVLPLADGDSTVVLGTITISGNIAMPETNPLDFIDSDGDGMNDRDDTDDDADGTEDEAEDDCDLDGAIDDHDDDSECEDDEAESDPNIAQVLEVKPANATEPDEDGVDLDKKVKARIGCQVTEGSVNAESFSVVSEIGVALNCEFNFSGSEDDFTTIKCEHENEDFLPGTGYTATINGILCEDGRSVESVSWQWTTETEDDDEGDTEDELDDADELEDDEADEEDATEDADMDDADDDSEEE